MSNRQDGEADAGRDTRRPATDERDGGDDRDDLPAPNPEISVEKTIKRQLDAIRTNDDPYTNAGIKTLFNFAAPSYRAEVGGSLEEFVDHVTGPIHRALIDHQEAERGRLRVDGDVAREKVVITDEDGEKVTYEFVLEKQGEGKYEGCWMTTDVELVYVGESPDHQHMPNVEFDGVEIKCKEGEILRDVLLRASGVSPYNQAAQYANCNGKGLCGTCAVEVADGEVTEKTAQERRRLRLPPHNSKDRDSYRLSCQCRVLSDLTVQKGEGFWGQHVEEYAQGTEEEPGEPIRVSDDEYTGTVAGAETGTDDGPGRGTDGDDLDLSDEARDLLDETEAMLDDDRDAPVPDDGDEADAEGDEGSDEEYDLPE